MKKLLTGICILATAGVITACGNGGSGQDTTTTPPQSTEAPTTTAAESADPEETTPEAGKEGLTESAGKESGEESEAAALLKEAETDDSVKAAVDADDTLLKEAPSEEIKTVSGEVKAVGMSAVTIVTESGEEISILKDEAEVDVAGELKEGSNVTVTYTDGEEGKIATFITDAIEE